MVLAQRAGLPARPDLGHATDRRGRPGPLPGHILAGARDRVRLAAEDAVDGVVRLPVFAASDFVPFGSPEPHAYVATVPVRPLGPPEQVGSLLEAHGAAGIELRVLTNLWPYWKRAIASTVGFSGIRLRNALPDPEQT